MPCSATSLPTRSSTITHRALAHPVHAQTHVHRDIAGDALRGYRPAMQPILERARRIADELLFPAALETDAADLLPVTNLDLLADEGFYGIGGPVEAGGLGLDPRPSLVGVGGVPGRRLPT